MFPQPIIQLLRKCSHSFHPVIQFDPLHDKLISLDFTERNTSLTAEIYNDIDLFCAYINSLLANKQALYGIGGYNELRALYGRSKLFSGSTATGEPRRLHLGTDIWGKAGTPVYAFMGGMVHSLGFNNALGDYGATMILSHQIDSFSFYTLYGHISLADVTRLMPGQYISRGELMAHFGEPNENGYWPPHLHFQIIIDIGVNEGDYPGVCKLSEQAKYLHNSPDPDLILCLNQFIKD